MFYVREHSGGFGICQQILYASIIAARDGSGQISFTIRFRFSGFLCFAQVSLIQIFWFFLGSTKVKNFNESSQIWDRFSPDLSLLASTSKKKQQLEFKIDGGKKQH